MVKPNGELTWNVKEIARALKIKEADVQAYCTDGRKFSFVLERRFAYEVMHGTLPKSEGASYDVIDKRGGKWEVRSLTASGIYFCPSYMVGSGRKFNSKGFLAKLSKIEGYLVSDLPSFPKVPFWIIPTSQIRNWWKSGVLGKTTSISRKKAHELFDSI